MVRIVIIALLSLSSILSSKSTGTNVLNYLEKARHLLNVSVLVDAHNDLPEKISNIFNGQIEHIDLTHLNSTFHTDTSRMRRGGVKVQIWSAYVKCTDYNVWNDAISDTLNQIDLIHRMIKSNDDLELATSTKEINIAVQKGKIASLIGLEGGHSIGDSAGVLRMMYDLGARYMTLTHTCHTGWADSCAKPPIHGGLSEEGIRGIHEMNRIGMMIDISHVSHETMKQVLEISTAPVIFSHSSAFALCKNPRNVPDNILKMISSRDGVVMVNFYPEFITCSSVATLGDVADHIDHIGNVAGRDHVGFGSDFDGIESVPQGLEDVTKYPNLIAEMIKRGWTDSQITGLIGLNFQRVFKSIQEHSTTGAQALESRIKRSKLCPKTNLFLQL